MLALTAPSAAGTLENVAGALRVVFGPEPVTVETVSKTQPRASIRFETLGPFSSGLAEDEPQPCTLRFFVSYIDRVRNEPPPEPKLVAKVSGEIVRIEGRFTFTAPDDTVLEHEPVPPSAEANEDPRRTRPLDYFLDFATDQFTLGACRLKVPRVKDDAARFVEVRTEVEVGGQTEVTLDTSAVWDIPYAPLQRRIILGVLDPRELGEEPLIVNKSSGAIAFNGAGDVAETTRSFDLTPLPPDDDYQLELAVGKLRLAPPLTINLRNLEFGLLLEDVAKAAQAVTTLENPLPDPVSGSEDHDQSDLPPFEETPANRDFLVITIVDAADAPLADRAFRATFADGTTTDGVLDEVGQATLRDIPEGDVLVELVDAPDALMTLADGTA